ncbi:MAG: Lrp/AsnC family transcriptional regulator [Pseudomonadota bacterium]
MEELDSFDRKILAAMELDARQTGNQLSELVGLSSAACLRRLQRLRGIGAIEREFAVINPSYR